MTHIVWLLLSTSSNPKTYGSSVFGSPPYTVHSKLIVVP